MAYSRKKLSVDQAKAEIIRLLGAGVSATDASELVGRSIKSFEYYRSSDPEFRARVDSIRIEQRHGVLPEGVERREVPDFPEFCEKYLGQRLFLHQLQWFDMLEGREPRDLHPSMTYEKGRPTRVIINTPPHHAKSTTITTNYIVWKIVQNPSFKVLVISKTGDTAAKFIRQIKDRLTDTQYAELQKDFAPAGGWKDGSSSWRANAFYVSGRNVEAKDPTVEAAGIRKQIYGARADMIILDDAVDNLNVAEYEKQIEWLLGIAQSRLAPRVGSIIVVGTRLAARDLYSELRDPNRYFGGVQPWTYLLQPAVLEYADDPVDWLTLWPFSNAPSDSESWDVPDENGLYRKWDGPTLAEVRASTQPSTWSRMYQQEQLAEDSVFTAELVNASTGSRKPGLLAAGPGMDRPQGMQGLRVFAGLDPAAAGYTAAVCVGLDLESGDRWVLDIHNESGMSPDAMKALLKRWTEKYGVHEWRVEDNAFQSFLTRDSQLISWMAARGTRFKGTTTTGRNKHDEGFGVQAMAGLFEAGLMHLPSSALSEPTRTLIEQLLVWQPKTPKGVKTDIVMALWFADLACLQTLQALAANGTRFASTIYDTRADKSRQEALAEARRTGNKGLVRAGGVRSLYRIRNKTIAPQVWGS